MGADISLRDLARAITEGEQFALHSARRWSKTKIKEALDKEVKLLNALDLEAGQKWYTTQGFKHDVGFERVSERSRYVRCVICRHGGAGVIGTYWDAERGGLMRQWQYDHSRAHTFECACGLFFPTSQALGAHVASNRRHRNAGHGRMDRVG